ncbi:MULTISPECIES: AraC family transcriptional regulator [unclassified Pseudomonas]|uniref:helix-turn-helix transcriptional regulator n=1 Tax=unclassified Pseudomonas TaxID=196821 RepID=UPI00095DAC8D|nr:MULTISPECIES: AraC family transcriptional regulator [unclassified Pseudomonas]OLU17134.1 AraC family transcriptional regulator [Pseudomonas sp. PA1(2017)]OLU35391.1 AraC family transcriptional regulator [Pseudomonas sp. PA27(2017)]
MSSLSQIPTYFMQQRSELTDFYIRDKRGRRAETAPHRHEYFQVQINLGGDTVQHIGNVERPFPRNTLAFILPHRVHVIPHPPESNFIVINFSQTFLLPHLQCDPMDLEDVSILLAPELSPFRFQQYLDFTLDDTHFAQVCALIEQMRELDVSRQFGVREILKGLMLQLIGLVCMLYAEPLKQLAESNAAQASRRDALGRMSEYLRRNIADPDLNLKKVAAATYLSPSYLTHWLRKEVGKTFSDMVLERRMHAARNHLLNGSKPVGEVARLCGFADEAYFSRRFRQIHGLPPGQFRRQQLNPDTPQIPFTD